MKDDQKFEAPVVDCSGCQGIMWWATLVVAVLAVPSFGFIVTRVVQAKGLGEIVVFILACWLCTFLGMKLMHNPSLSQKIGNHHPKDKKD